MDTPSAPARPLPASATTSASPRGGTVEPARRDTDNHPGAEPRPAPAAEQYELRDPFAEVTYRSTRIEEMAAQAERLGATRFTALDAQGQRTPVHKVDGRWQRDTPDARAPSPTAPSTANRPDRSDGPDPAQRTEDRGVRPDASQAPTNASPTPRPASDRPDPKPAVDLDAQDHAAQIARLESGLMERYLIKRATLTVNDVSVGTTEYRFRGDTSRVAFTETGFKLATDANSPSVARSMVDVAQARNWQSLRVSGSEEFRRLVWLEAGARGVKALGYEPSPADLERLKVERDQRQANRIEPLPGPAASPGANLSTQAAAKTSARGNGGRKAVLVAIEAVLVDKKVPAKQREAIMDAAAERLAQRARDGQTPRVKVYDKTAPSQHKVVPPTPVPAQQPQRSRERAAPVR